MPDGERRRRTASPDGATAVVGTVGEAAIDGDDATTVDGCRTTELTLAVANATLPTLLGSQLPALGPQPPFGGGDDDGTRLMKAAAAGLVATDVEAATAAATAHEAAAGPFADAAAGAPSAWSTRGSAADDSVPGTSLMDAVVPSLLSARAARQVRWPFGEPNAPPDKETSSDADA